MTAEVTEHVESAACRRPVEALLQAAVDELEGRAPSELAGHIRGCERCGALAQAILSGHGALDDSLGTALHVDAHRIIALGRARRDASVRPWSGWRLRVALPTWVAATAGAASVAVALLLVLPGQERPARVWEPPPAPPVASAPFVDAPHHNVAVIETGNPDITVFWFYKE